MFLGTWWAWRRRSQPALNTLSDGQHILPIYTKHIYLHLPARVSFLVPCCTSLNLPYPPLSLSLPLPAWLPAYCAHLFLSADNLFHSHSLTSLPLAWSSLPLPLVVSIVQFFTVCLLFAFSVCRCVVCERVNRWMDGWNGPSCGGWQRCGGSMAEKTAQPETSCGGSIHTYTSCRECE